MNGWTFTAFARPYVAEAAIERALEDARRQVEAHAAGAPGVSAVCLGYTRDGEPCDNDEDDAITVACQAGA